MTGELQMYKIHKQKYHDSIFILLFMKFNTHIILN